MRTRTNVKLIWYYNKHSSPPREEEDHLALARHITASGLIVGGLTGVVACRQPEIRDLPLSDDAPYDLAL